MIGRNGSRAQNTEGPTPSSLSHSSCAMKCCLLLELSNGLAERKYHANADLVGCCSLTLSCLTVGEKGHYTANHKYFNLILGRKNSDPQEQCAFLHSCCRGEEEASWMPRAGIPCIQPHTMVPITEMPKLPMPYGYSSRSRIPPVAGFFPDIPIV